MPKPSLRTRSFKRHVQRLPSGDGKTIHYDRPKIKALKCLSCGRTLSGAPYVTAPQFSRLPLSKKHPNRALGGQLCHMCLQQLLKEAARSTTPS